MTEPNPSSSHIEPLRQNLHQQYHDIPPAHHVIVPRKEHSLPLLPSFAQSFIPTGLLFVSNPSSISQSTKEDSLLKYPSNGPEYIRTGFRNPWPSWHKPQVEDYWYGLHWGKASTSESASLQKLEEGQRGDKAVDDMHPMNVSLDSQKQSLMEDEENELQIVEPEFDSREESIVQATWLGHATVLLQLPNLDSTSSGKPIRILFDPIFSMRCSPSQFVGPIRSYPPPCPISSLPAIDLVIISHSHYDHLDYDTIVQLWAIHKAYLRFVVPLGLREWFLRLGIGIDQDRVTELDWWDELWLDQKFGGGEDISKGEMLRIVCTPAQHGSGRNGFDASQSLWSSWTLEHISRGCTYRIFFGGDTGFQFHSPVPDATIYPTCPAFAEVALRIGKPDLSFLPISVGASMNFVKTIDVIGVVPDVDKGLTAANHMTPYDAVRVSKILRGKGEHSAKESNSRLTSDSTKSARVVAIHWGTFVTGLDEVHTSMQNLRQACHQQGVHYTRLLDERQDGNINQDSFACLNHGQSVYLKIN